MRWLRKFHWRLWNPTGNSIFLLFKESFYMLFQNANKCAIIIPLLGS